MSDELTASNVDAPTQFLQAGDETYAYRRFGSGLGLPLLFLQHFIGTLDNWDPAVQQLEKLPRSGARRGRVLTGDQQAVGDDADTTVFGLGRSGRPSP